MINRRMLRKKNLNKELKQRNAITKEKYNKTKIVKNYSDF